MSILRRGIGKLGKFYTPDRELLERLWLAWRRSHAQPWEQCVRALLPPDRAGEDLAALFSEFVCETPDLEETVNYYKDVIGKDWAAKTTARAIPSIAFLYVLSRVLKPSVVVETGCATGWTSSVILAALQRNQHGNLYSIDVRAVAGQLSMGWSLPDDLDVGFLIPSKFRSRWTLINGNTRDGLPSLLQQVQHIDLFYHDSDHTYQHMMWEYCTAFSHIRNGGILVSDDIGFNLSFVDFSREARAPMVVCESNLNFGAIRKRG